MNPLREELPLALASQGYDAAARLRARHGGGDWFECRMLGRRALVVRGPEGVRRFYDRDLVTRVRAVPAPLRLLLFGPGAVHGLEGDAHLDRKRLFHEIITTASVSRLAADVDRRLGELLDRCPEGEQIHLFHQLATVYGEAVIAWAGITTSTAEARTIARELALVVDGFGIRGTAWPRAALARVRSERWAARIVREARAGRRPAPPGTALAVMAGSELPTIPAATELLNVLRPTVAVAFFGAFTADALTRRPEWRPRLADGTDDERRAFEHELRRWYPFAPLLPGRLRRPLDWQGERMEQGDWIILDIVGTNRDPATWPDPDTFRPERFLDDAGRVIEPDMFDYVPHGGGDARTGHRCPGEPSAAALLEVTLRRMAQLRIELGEGADEIPLRRIPSRAGSGTPVVVRRP